MPRRTRRGKRGGACVYNDAGNPTQEECPGRSILVTRPVIPYDPETSIYLISGHGCDMIDDIKTVPVNCEYITKGICGIETSTGESWLKFYDEFGKGTNEKLKNPLMYIKDIKSSYNPTNTNKMMNMVFATQVVPNLPNTTVLSDMHVHSLSAKDINMRQYVNSKNTCFVTPGVKAGLYRLGTNLDNVTYDESLQFRDYILKHYEGSLYPTQEDIRTLLESVFTGGELDRTNLSTSEKSGLIDRSILAIKINFSIDMSTLMERFPGKLYNISCRPVCRGKLTKSNYLGTNPHVLLRRQASAVGNSAETAGGRRKRNTKRRRKSIKRLIR